MNKPPSHGPFELQLTVQASDIDPLGHVNNVVYVQWVQDAAVAHWFATATQAQQDTLLWVVARHEIEYKRPASLGAQVIVRTWVGKASHGLFVRHTQVLRKDDGKTLAKAVTWWAPMDKQSLKHIKPDELVYRMYSDDSQ